MKTFMLLRHAKSSWADENSSDFDRPLNARGLRDAPKMAAFMQAAGLIPDAIYCSTAKRAKTTIELLTDEIGYEGSVRWVEDLYLAPPSTYVEIARQVDDSAESIMMVGHNPGIEALVQALIGSWERMPTAALAVIRVPIERWRDFPPPAGGELVEVYRPKEID